MTTSEFAVSVANRQFVQFVPQQELTFRPLRWSGAAFGGPKSAEIEVTGSWAALKALRDWLRYSLDIVTPRGTRVWWGYVHEVELQHNGLTVVASMDGLYNRICIKYTTTEAAIEESMSTAWAENTVSSGDYGTKEHIESLGQASTSMATALRDRMLAISAQPRLKRSIGGDLQDKVILRCRGWYAAQAWKYYQRSDGRIENMSGSAKVQPIGWGIVASSLVGFGDTAVPGIHDATGRLGALRKGHLISVTGSASNNRTFTVAVDTSEEVKEYTASTIRFEPSDDIIDSAGGLSFAITDHWLYVYGSALNSRWHWIANPDASHIRTSSGISGLIVAESAGPSIKLTQAQKLLVSEATNPEAPSASVTVTHRGHRVAQSLTVGVAMRVARVQIEAAKVGSPTDNLTVEIYSNSSGAPGSLLTSGTLAGASLTTDVTALWVSVTAVTLAAGTYWIAIKRSGSLDGANHYSVGMSDTVYGSALQWTGSAWEAHTPGWSLRFRLWGVEDTGKIAETALASVYQFVTLQAGYTTGIEDFTAMDQIAIGADEVERALSVGTSAGLRALIDVTPDRILYLFTQPVAAVTANLLLYAAHGQVRLTDMAGTALEPGVLPYGQWVELSDFDPDLAEVSGLSPAFIDEAAYDASVGAWQLAFEGERNLADMLKVQQG